MKNMNNLVNRCTYLVALLMMLLGSCAQEEKSAVQPTPSVTGMSEQSLSALVDLYLGENTDANWKKFQGSYQKLSLEELLTFRKLQLTRQAGQAKGAQISAEMLAQDAEKYTGLYKQALSETGVAINRMSPEQQDAFFTKLEKSETSASSARTEQVKAGCQVINFNVINGVGYGDILGNFWFNNALVDPGGKNDCDCEIYFTSTQRYGQVLSPTSLEHRALAFAFNDRIAGRHYLLSGYPYISTAVFGRTRMYYVYGRVDCGYLGFKMNNIR